MRVRRRTTVDADPGDVWAVLATGVPVATGRLRRGRLSSPAGELPEPGGSMDLLDAEGPGEAHAATARITAYRPPRLLSWSVVDPILLIGAVSGAYRISGRRASLIELELRVERRSLFGALLTPVLWLLVGRLADGLLDDLVTEIESRPRLVSTPSQRAAIRIATDAELEEVAQGRLSEGRIYAFRVNRDVLVALHGAAAGGHGQPRVSRSTLTEMTRAVNALQRDDDSRLLSVSADEARELRDHLGSLEQWASRTGRKPMAEHARAAREALEAVVATDFLTTVDAAG